jgi:AraC family transcriptional regulator, transcriptional activator of pobA
MTPACATLRGIDRLGRERPLFVGRLVHEGRPLGQAVTHDYIALTFCTKGTAAMELRERWTLTPGCVLVLPAGEPHRMLETQGAEFWGLGFCASCLLDDIENELFDLFDRVRSGGSAVMHVPEARRAFLESLFVELHRETARPDGGSLAAQKSLLTLVLTEVRRAGSSGEADTTATMDIVAGALRFIERHCLAPLSLRDVAEAVHRSPAHLTTLVRKATGRSVGAWIITHRLAEARRRLLHTDELVDVIAERVGYQDPTHFIRMFRRAHGVTPSAWRAKNRAGRVLPARRAARP